MNYFLEVANQLLASPKLIEKNQVEILPRTEFDLEELVKLAEKRNLSLLINRSYLLELEESWKELESFRSFLFSTEIPFDVIGVNKKLLKYRMIVFPRNEEIKKMLKMESDRLANLEVIYEISSALVKGERDEEENQERRERIRQKEELRELLRKWRIESVVTGVGSVEIYPNSHKQRQELYRKLREFTLLDFSFSTKNYTKIPMTIEEKKEIIRNLALKFRKYGNGFLEIVNSYTLRAYARSEKLKKLYEKIFSEYWYRYVDVDGNLKSLRLEVELLYQNGQYFDLEEWRRIKHKMREKAESFDFIQLEFLKENIVVIHAQDFEKAKKMYWARNYHECKVEIEEKIVRTEILFKVEG
ncbi:hypothetical protein ACJXDE_05560 [Enterococcus faecium]|uniref:hypothetical protein n=1 Tax=Enterococcus faecium TaxID=1352 RepID=UPI0038D3C95C